MNTYRFALFASVLMTVACSSLVPRSEPGHQVAATGSATEHMNEIVKLKQENITLIKELSAALKSNVELETMVAELVKKQSINNIERTKREEERTKHEEVKKKQVIQDAFRAASADVDVYYLGADQQMQQFVEDAMLQKGFKPHYPALPTSMGVANSTTVFYYDDSFIPVAADLVKQLAAVLNSEINIMRGVSPYGKNKLIVHIVGSDQ